ncbi:helix-turn-helix transcriptional regulator [Hymenobacter psychrotolerans]|uniref:Homeodomain-like domain-containing protein n=1 Tax=Hymenobacter psychrotolerans DSM 18569 TaxID=1121959 RepID=A0A1M7E5M7_9BACT|nr:helix-turn-helix domain-containing protein [Hymenobacter psychrotolerans]SHL87051.1 Homeodomain-like domain-containing protein [Hymenobacter psychrotolerans DSM 18569]
MQATDLATAGFIQENFQVLLAHLQALRTDAPAAAPLTPRLLSIEQVMEECGVSRSTVQRWMKAGKPGRHGGTVTLQAYYFSPAEPRIPWPALAAFGQGLAFDLSTLAPAGAAPAPTHLRKAS